MKVCKYNYFSGPQLWKLNGNRLLNKEGLWMSNHKWNFITDFGNWIYIEDISNAKCLGITNDKVVLEKKDEEYRYYGQLWKKGEPNAEGYFTLEHYSVQKLMTATSSTSLEVKGNITKVDNP
jgi:hypothetical protein